MLRHRRDKQLKSHEIKLSQPVSNSQSGQDLWVISYLSGLRNGFFLELGAGDGVWISNTLVLERDLGWTGILIEPTTAFEELIRNRPNAICLNACVAAEQKEVTLFEVFDRGQALMSPKASENTLLSVVRDDLSEVQGDATNSAWGQFKRAYRRMAYPLTALLDQVNAPAVIDYFSLDVEGYEYEVLRNFSFDRYFFRILGVERPSARLDALLRRKGYVKRGVAGEDVMYVHSPSAIRKLLSSLRIWRPQTFSKRTTSSRPHRGIFPKAFSSR